MDGRIINATKWAFITEILGKLVTPLTNVILAHILAPSAFGVLATVLMVVSFAEMLADAGFEKYMVQHNFSCEREKLKATNVAFVANVVFALILWLIIIIFKDPLSSLVGNKGLGNALALMGATLPLTAFTSVQLAMYRREFDFKFVLKTRMVTVMTPLIIAVPLALLGVGYWALIIGILASKLFLAILLIVYGNVHVKWEFDFKVFQNMISFSSWSMLEAFSIWLTAWIDMFLVGSYFNEYYLGLYRMPVAMVNAAMAIITNSILPVLFAALSRVQSDNRAFMDIFLKFQRYVAMCICPVGVLIFVFRDMGIRVLLGSQWHEGALVLGLWALSNSIVIVISYLQSEVFRAKGLPGVSFISQILHLAVLIPIVYYFVQDSFIHFIYARSLVRLEGILVGVILLKYVLKFDIYVMFKNISKYIFASLLLLIVLEPLVEVYKNTSIQLLFLILGIGIYLVLLMMFKQDREIIKNMFNIASKKISVLGSYNIEGNNSLKVISFIKLIMMVLVVLYHSSIIYMLPSWSPVSPVYNSSVFKYFAEWLNTVHIYTFTAMSGCIFYYLVYESKRYKIFNKIILNKCNRLLKPYFITSILWAIPFYMVFYTYTIDDIFKKYILGISPSQLWFLLMLFLVFAIFSYLIKLIDFSKASIIRYFIILLGVYYFTSVFNLFHIPNFFQFQTSLKYLIFFYIGMMLRRYLISSNILYGGIFLLLSAGIFTIEIFLNNKYFTLLTYPILCMMSVLAAYMIVGWCTRFINLESGFLIKIESYLMIIYLLHQQIIYICIEIFNKPIFAPYQFVALTFVITLVVSYVLAGAIKNFIKKSKSLFN